VPFCTSEQLDLSDVIERGDVRLNAGDAQPPFEISSVDDATALSMGLPSNPQQPKRYYRMYEVSRSHKIAFCFCCFCFCFVLFCLFVRLYGCWPPG
jgi:hypothetical protein